MAALFEEMMEEYVILDETTFEDGAGGTDSYWKEGAHFKAAVTMDTTMQAEIAMKEGVTSVYTVTTGKEVKLKYHTVFKRISDGRIFRTTSDSGDKVAPKVSTLNIAQVKAEKFEL